MVGLATCLLHPQAIHGLPPIYEAGLKVIQWECLQVKDGQATTMGSEGYVNQEG